MMCSNYTRGQRDRNQERFGILFGTLDEHESRVFAGVFIPRIKPNMNDHHMNACKHAKLSN